MAEKRVSVRLVAEGGRQVRAELEGIGEAGTRGFGRLGSDAAVRQMRCAGLISKKDSKALRRWHKNPQRNPRPARACQPCSRSCGCGR